MDQVLLRLEDVRSARTDEDRVLAAKALRETLEGEEHTGSFAMTMSSSSPMLHQRKDVMQQVQMSLQKLLLSKTAADRFGGLAVLLELLSLAGEQDSDKLQWTYQGLHSVLKKVYDIETARRAAHVLGILARWGGHISNRAVNAELAVAIERLGDSTGSDEKASISRAAAVMVIHQLTLNAPTVVYGTRTQIIESIWNGVCDVRLDVRLESASALGALLRIVGQRELSESEIVVSSLINKIDSWLGPGKGSTQQIHGALLALNELLTNPAVKDLIIDELERLCDTVLYFQDHRDRHVRRTVAVALPCLSASRPDLFSGEGGQWRFDSSFRFLAQLVRSRQSDAAFYSLSQTATTVGKDIFQPYVKESLELVQFELQQAPRNSSGSTMALACAASIIRISSSSDDEFVRSLHRLLDSMCSVGLSSALVDACQAIATHVPSLKTYVQERILHSASEILKPRESASQSEICEALIVVGSIDLSGIDSAFLCNYARDCFAHHMGCHRAQIRLEAVKSLAKILRTMTVEKSSVLDTSVFRETTRIVSTCITDPDPHIRHVAFDELVSCPSLYPYLCQPERLRELLLGLYDERLYVQEKAIELIGKLSVISPAYTLPSLRKFLIDTIVALKSDGYFLRRYRSQRGHLLSIIVRDAPNLVTPYAHRIAGVAVVRIQDALARRDIEDATPLVTTVAYLSGLLVDLSAFVEELMPLLMRCLRLSSSEKQFRITVFHAMSNFVNNSGFVITPYIDDPTVLDSILSALKNEDQSTREAASRLLGSLGAVDPEEFKHAALPLATARDIVDSLDNATSQSSFNSKKVFLRDEVGAKQSSLSKQPNQPWSTSNQIVHYTESPAWSQIDLKTESLIGRLSHPFTGNPEYFPSASLDALHKVLADNRLFHLHRMAVAAIVSIIQSLGPKCYPYLSATLPRLLWLIRPASPRENSFREFVLKQLGEIVQVAQQHIKHFVNDIFLLIEEYWDAGPQLLKHILELVERVCGSLGDEFRAVLGTLLPRVLRILNSEDSVAVNVFRAFETFGRHLDDHPLPMFSSIIAVIEDPRRSVLVRNSGLKSLARLVRVLSIVDHGPSLIHPLVRIIQSRKSHELSVSAAHALFAIGLKIPSIFGLFEPLIRMTLRRSSLTNELLEELLDNWNNADRIQRLAEVDRNVAGQGIPFSGVSPGGGGMRRPDHLGPVGGYHINASALQEAWQVGRRCTREDWEQWIQALGSALFRESGHASIRSCARIAEAHQPLARELFNAAFLSCWRELQPGVQPKLAEAVENALSSPSLPLDVLQTLLSLAEYMEHDEKPLPIDLRLLAAVSLRCGALAKALHYKEVEYSRNAVAAVSGDDGLISIYDALGHRESAVGTLVVTERSYGLHRREQWLTKLQKWDEALIAYEAALELEQDARIRWEYRKGQIRCLNELGEWRKMDLICQDEWTTHNDNRIARVELACVGAVDVVLNRGRWDQFLERVQYLSSETFDGAVLRAISFIHGNRFDKAQNLVEEARRILDTGLAARAAEGYPRAYEEAVKAQMLVELDEAIALLRIGKPEAVVRRLANAWSKRLMGCRRDHRTWHKLLAIRSLLLTPSEMEEDWLQFASICRNSGRLPMASEALRALLPSDKIQAGIASAIVYQNLSSDRIDTWNPDVVLEGCNPKVVLSFLEHLWASGRKKDAYLTLKRRAWGSVNPTPKDARMVSTLFTILVDWSRRLRESSEFRNGNTDDLSLNHALECGLWAAQIDPTWSGAWRSWALVNVEAIEVSDRERRSPESPLTLVIHAIVAFFRSISLAGSKQKTNLQDALRILTLWFRYGENSDVSEAVFIGANSSEPDMWLDVIPQMIARLHSPIEKVRSGLKQLLLRVGAAHPQALVYPLTVAALSTEDVRRQAAVDMLDQFKLHSPVLVEQAGLVSHELIRVAILWNELWHEGLEEAARLHFGEKNTVGMLTVLEPLHRMMEAGPETLREKAFHRDFANDLSEAYELCNRFKANGHEEDINRAWDLYYHVFSRVNKQLPQLTSLELSQVSPKLLNSKSLEIVVPGTYTAGSVEEGLVTIVGFAPTCLVIASKQRPRKIVMYGSDGKEYAFLLKGHEDLRQDERVMQLFGLVNNLFAQSEDPGISRDLAITRFSVIPLSGNSGLIGWVPGCDTLHAIVKDFREGRRVLLNVEHRLMLKMAPNYDILPLYRKVEVFEFALNNTTGSDIAKVLWLKSRNAEMWLDRRTNFIRSLAMMSIVGYILGLGDRHPSNLMLERDTGKILHIDFGDCFEVAMTREKYPEKIPFRLTRMLQQALEKCGVEGYFRHTCEAVMRVLRDDSASVMAMLEAFAYDPLVNWRLMVEDDGAPKTLVQSRAPEIVHHANEDLQMGRFSLSKSRRLLETGAASLRDIAQFATGESSRDPGETLTSQTARSRVQRPIAAGNDYADVINRKAVAAIRRVSNKLSGRDFESDIPLGVPEQVDRLIHQAMDVELLCQCYVGWCAFW
uniref:Serine/threonine-protein kinase TOR n=1 Tax=Compsopogon caeruleus TaxID=31354 RepID=A0A7S1TEY1_9RHOD|mmetsp:Transcript_3941/g.7600  ORF Transcript_3941/g.7600 Transcript_3941/m.7600 type:complete len:2475 (+) Transcript_3941:26-7450(+)